MLCRATHKPFKRGRVCLAGATGSILRNHSNISQIVGHSNECSVTVNDNILTALLDTGANVSTISHSMYSKLFPDQLIRPLEDFKLDIECAGDQKLPYSGYVEVDIGIPGVVDLIECLLLVTPDTRYGHKVPAILGTNVLKPLMKATELKHGIRYQQTVKMPDSLYFTFR